MSAVGCWGKLLHECEAKRLRLGLASLITSRIWRIATCKQVLLKTIAERLAEAAASL